MDLKKLKTELIDIINRFPGHLIATSACLGGELPTAALAYERATDLSEKAELLNLEFDKFRISTQSIENKKKIKRMLDRYFGPSGWIDYWFTTNTLSKNSVELTLHVLLNDESTIIDVTSLKDVKKLTICSH